MQQLTSPEAQHYLGSSRSFLSAIKANPYDADISVAQTIERMKEIVWEEAENPSIIELAKQITRHSRNSKEAINDIFKYVKTHIVFTDDEGALATLGLDANSELLIKPSRLLLMPKPMGDCDDFSMLTASLLIISGFPVWFVTIAADPTNKQEFSHVYVKTQAPDGEVIALDTSHGPIVGWETDEKYREKDWFVGIGKALEARGEKNMDETSLAYKGMRFGGQLGGLGQDSQIVFDTPGGYATGMGTSVGVTSPAWWQNLLGAGAQTGLNILSYQFGPGGGPKPGSYYQTTPGGGTVAYTLPQGAQTVGFSNIPGLESPGSNYLIWLLIAGVFVFAIAKR